MAFSVLLTLKTLSFVKRVSKLEKIGSLSEFNLERPLAKSMTSSIFKWGMRTFVLLSKV